MSIQDFDVTACSRAALEPRDTADGTGEGVSTMKAIVDRIASYPCRRTARGARQPPAARQLSRRRVLVMGTNAAVAPVIATIRAQRWLGMDIVGAVAATGCARISMLARRRRLDRPRDVPLRLRHRLGQVAPARQAGRDRGREHAAGAVQASALAAGRAELAEAAAVVAHVDRVAGEV